MSNHVPEVNELLDAVKELLPSLTETERDILSILATTVHEVAVLASVGQDVEGELRHVKAIGLNLTSIQASRARRQIADFLEVGFEWLSKAVAAAVRG